MRRIIVFSTIFLVMACATVQDISQTIRDAGVKPLSVTQDKSEKLVSTGSCPKVEIVDDLAMLYEFTNENNPAPQNMISQAEIISAQSTCFYGLKSVTVDLKLDIESKMGPSGTLQSTDKPFFAYPFFVAVTSPGGSILAKEVFSASVTYSPGQDRHIYHEELRQIIPIDSRYDGSRFKILVGFQTTEAQLEYNRKLIEQHEAEKLLSEQRAHQATMEQTIIIEDAARGTAATIENVTP